MNRTCLFLAHLRNREIFSVHYTKRLHRYAGAQLEATQKKSAKKCKKSTWRHFTVEVSVVSMSVIRLTLIRSDGTSSCVFQMQVALRDDDRNTL